MRYNFEECMRIREYCNKVTGKTIECIVADLNRAISQLSRPEKNLLKYKFVENYDWEYISVLYRSNVSSVEIMCNEIMTKLLNNLVTLGIEPEENIVITSETNINNLKLLNRTYHALTRAGIMTVGELTNLSEKELLKTKMVGKESVNNVINVLEKHNLKLSRDYNIGLNCVPPNTQKNDIKTIKLVVTKNRLNHYPVTVTFDYDESSEYIIL